MKTLIVLFAAASTFFGVEAFGCSCAQPGTPTAALAQANTVFSGKVTSITKVPNRAHYSNRVQFEILRKWKGITWIKNVTVVTSESSAACGYGFVEGKTYLVYAFLNEEGSINTHLCSRTKPLVNAAEDLAEIGEGDPVQE